MDSASARDKLCWDAFRYIAEEMSPPERAAFESLLDSDQAAREAVAEIVCLSSAVQTVERIRRSAPGASSLPPQQVAGRVGQFPAPARSRIASIAAPAGWMALGAAASLAAVLMAQSWNAQRVLNQGNSLVSGTARESTTPGVAPIGIDSQQVAWAWSEGADDSYDGEASEAEAESSDTGLSDGDAAVEDDSTDRDWDTPSWISAGVSDIHSQPATAREQ